MSAQHAIAEHLRGQIDKSEDRLYDTMTRAVHYETSLDIVDLRLKAGLDVRTTLEGLQESIRFTREYIARMKEGK